MRLKYFSCDNGHIVLDAYMPQSGFTCNVSGCGLPRREYSADAREILVYANALLTEIHGSDAAHSQAAIDLENYIKEGLEKYFRRCKQEDEDLRTVMWGAGLSLPPSDAEHRVRQILFNSLPGEQTDNWLKAKNRLLGGAAPIDLLDRNEEFDRMVIDAAEQFVDGDPL